jgi:hypothetical protein
MNGFSVFALSLSILVLAIFIAHISLRKGKPEDVQPLKYAIIGGLICIYLSWGIVYMAHLKPAISP